MIRYWLPSLALLALAGVVGCELDRLLWVRCSDYVLRSANECQRLVANRRAAILDEASDMHAMGIPPHLRDDLADRKRRFLL